MGVLDFAGQVVLVTGAGNGLGRAYALAFASRGARVVVNDLGGSVQGTGSDARAAQIVVDEIKQAGGTAVADFHSVEQGDLVVKTAIDNFGRIDVVVNNAGILRDSSFAKSTDKDWDLVNNVHLKGSYVVSRAAWPHMKAQNHGRIIMTSSTSGLFGNFGQANYSAAKMGVVGLANTLAIEGAKYGITCNTIVPTAGSRLSAHVMPTEFAAAMKPEYIAPVVLWLAHRDCTHTKGIVEAGGGWVAEVGLQRSPGRVLNTEAATITAEAVRDSWSAITDMSQAVRIKDSLDTTKLLIDLVAGAKGSSPVQDGVDVAVAMSFKFAASTFEVTPAKVCLYNVSLGCDSVADAAHTRFLYEGHELFAALPTFAVLPAQAGLHQLMEGVPGFKFNPVDLLHGEQTVVLHQPFPTDGVLVSTPSFTAISRKGNAVFVKLKVDTSNAQGTLIATNTFNLFIKNITKFKGTPTTADDAKASKPSAPPVKTVSEVIPTNSAAIYRLNGDINPLHIDPEFAKAAGFEQPILHGLCTFGYGVKHVIFSQLGGDHVGVSKMHGRFAAPVFPGDELTTSIWKTPTGFYFECAVKGRAVLTHGVVDCHAPKSPATEQSAPKSSSKVAAVFDALASSVSADMIAQIKAIFRFKIKEQGETHVWTIDLKSSGSVTRGPSDTKADTTITIAEEDFLNLVAGSLNPMQAFMQGKLKIAGNMMLAQKLQVLFQAQRKTAKL